jgi:hypothetical protein
MAVLAALDKAAAAVLTFSASAMYCRGIKEAFWPRVATICVSSSTSGDQDKNPTNEISVILVHSSSK